MRIQKLSRPPLSPVQRTQKDSMLILKLWLSSGDATSGRGAVQTLLRHIPQDLKVALVSPIFLIIPPDLGTSCSSK